MVGYKFLVLLPGGDEVVGNGMKNFPIYLGLQSRQ